MHDMGLLFPLQMEALSEITSVCTANDLKMVIRLIKGDLRIQVMHLLTSQPLISTILQLALSP